MKYALTGGIGSGKSYVCQLLRQRGIDVYDCDAAAKRLMRTNRDIQRRLSEAVGKEVFPGGVLDKAVLATFLLASEDNNLLVNSIVHPAVGQDFTQSGMTWMECAILFEANFQRYVDKVICVSAPLDVRIQRIIQRDGICHDKALEWINRQMPQEEKENRSDYVIINDGIQSLEQQIDNIIKE